MVLTLLLLLITFITIFNCRPMHSLNILISPICILFYIDDKEITRISPHHPRARRTMRNREIRIALYSGFIGLMTALILVLIYHSRSDARRRRIDERARRQEERYRALAAEMDFMNAQKPCAGQKVNIWEQCPQCPVEPIRLPETLHKFVDDHMKNQRGSPLTIAKAQSKG